MIVLSCKLGDCEVVVECICEVGGKVEVFVCYVGCMEDIVVVFDIICCMYGWLDIFINNVVVNLYFGYIFDMDLVVYEKIVEVNICGYFFMLVEVGKMMKV